MAASVTIWMLRLVYTILTTMTAAAREPWNASQEMLASGRTHLPPQASAELWLLMTIAQQLFTCKS